MRVGARPTSDYPTGPDPGAATKENTMTDAVTTPSTSTGTTVIDDAVVAKVAGIAAREVSGVFALGGGAARALGALRNVVNSTDLTQGISVEVGETQVDVTVTIVAEYPQPLQGVADDVRASIISAVESIVGLPVTTVDITISDVHFATDDDDAA